MGNQDDDTKTMMGINQTDSEERWVYMYDKKLAVKRINNPRIYIKGVEYIFRSHKTKPGEEEWLIPQCVKKVLVRKVMLESLIKYDMC